MATNYSSKKSGAGSSRSSTASGGYKNSTGASRKSSSKAGYKSSTGTAGRSGSSAGHKRSSTTAGGDGFATGQKNSAAAGHKSGSQTGRGSAGSAARVRRRRRTADSNLLILRLLILVVGVLVVFEGKLIATMFTQHNNPSAYSSSASAGSARTESVSEADVSREEAVDSGKKGTGSQEVNLAGFGAAGGETAKGKSSETVPAAQSASASEDGKISEALDSPKVVPLQQEKVDDSYFSDAVFIGDSRMEGFRNTSGITQGVFMTSVGMSLSAIGDTKVNTSDGEITVYQGLSGRQYGKIYIMLGANDLGYYPWEEFKDHAEKVLSQMHELQPNAVIYVCGVIYVEGQKIATEYVNNDNVRKVNGYLLEACEDLDYCWYLNLNEVFTNGYGALIDGATNDGVHMSGKYTALMLDYLKGHYLLETLAAEPAQEEATEAE